MTNEQTRNVAIRDLLEADYVRLRVLAAKLTCTHAQVIHRALDCLERSMPA